MIRLALIDDHTLVRTGFRLLLERQPDIEVVGEAGDGESGLAMLRRLRPDVALVDVNMPGTSGLDLTERVRRAGLPTRIVVLTMMIDAPYPRRLLTAGASGYVTKGGAADELLRAVRVVADGHRYLTPVVAQQLAMESIGEADSPFGALSTRELEVVLMLARGDGMAAIARRLSLSAKTVATYKYRAFDKLDIDNPVKLARLAHAHGLLEYGIAGGAAVPA